LILRDPWSRHDAKEYEWLRSEDSYIRAIERGLPDRRYMCQYKEIKTEPVYSVEDSVEPAGFQDIAVFKARDEQQEEVKSFEISKRLVDLEGDGRWRVGDWLTLKIRGCCNVVAIEQ
jgi:hypothetical protein